MKKTLFLLGTLLAVLGAFAGPVAADQLAQAAPAPSPSPSASPTPNPLQVSGYLDAGYEQATAWGPKGAITGRVFDNVSGRPQLQTINLTAAYNGTFGGKVELNAGTDANVIHSYPQSLYICPSGTTCPPFNLQLDLTQAYASFSAGKFTLIGGKFETLAGAEVIESPSDLNFSRSILFGYAIPFTHTGLRLTYAATSQLNVIVGANRGWDTTRTLSSGDLAKFGAPPAYSDKSGNLTAEFGLAWNPTSTVSVTAQGYSGAPENQGILGCVSPAGTATNCNRSVFDVVGTWHVTPALTAIVNGDLGQQTNTPSAAFTSGIGTVTWKGVAGYLSYAFNPSITETLRYEQFVDAQGYRTGLGYGMTWSEGTATTQFTIAPNAIVRGELRFDNANAPFFAANGGAGAQKWLTTYGLEAIYHLP